MNLTQQYTAEDIQKFLVSNLAEAVELSPEEIDVKENIGNYGLDSTQAMMIIGKLEKLLGFQPSPVLLWNYPNIADLSDRLAEEYQDNSELQHIDKISNHNINTPSLLDLGAEAILDPTIQPIGNYTGSITHPQNIFVTGGTGYLAAFIIKELLLATVAKIYCLVRADNISEAKNKLVKNLENYAIWDDQYQERIIPIIGDLAEPFLGIASAEFANLAANIDTIYHSAALLNYVYPYSALKPANVLGTQEILRLACTTKTKLFHYVSSIAVFESPFYAGKVVKEQDAFNHWEGIFLGYSQTKWVAEKLVKIAGYRGLPITIYRPPLIAGDSQTGVCNPDDFLNLMIKGCFQMGYFPDVNYMLDMSPVDYVSKAIVYLSTQEKSLGKAFNLQHPQPASLKYLVEWIRSFAFHIKMIPYQEWQKHLVNNVTSPENPFYTLRPFLLERWSDEQLTVPDLYLQDKRPIISCAETLEALTGSGVVCPKIDSQLLTTYASYLIQSGFLSLS
ncbi:thioester reductase domain-containing protein [Anabaena sp. FACHB-1237]|uniref:thioester reductase domain-containing protein n=1 Tax=Anabaena sp. FACHB-1237 TaxID=2692769 RepID=UPI0016803FF3|nr:thioester reductase domain-containing protein [Anabaena sp. FACHB-1237]MBD2136387.1 thioester reductase domain-containing protein [Anabaena sp. FACHB-1237]